MDILNGWGTMYVIRILETLHRNVNQLQMQWSNIPSSPKLLKVVATVPVRLDFFLLQQLSRHDCPIFCKRQIFGVFVEEFEGVVRMKIIHRILTSTWHVLAASDCSLLKMYQVNSISMVFICILKQQRRDCNF